ncbi:MAG: transcription antitermination factor NusB [Verrucomicrobiota bacterium]
MGKRRDGRVLATQFLYAWECREPDRHEWKEEWALFLEMTEPAASVKNFAFPRIEGVLSHREELDKQLSQVSQNWDLDRMAIVDRCILRQALFEILHCDDVPPVVAINEAIELAKDLSTPESGKFVNGLLDRIRKELKPHSSSQ